MAVLLTVAQNRFLLNSLRGEGFLNMRLTDEEAKEAVGIDPVTPGVQPSASSRALPAGARRRTASSSAPPTAPSSCPRCCAGRRCGRGCRKGCGCSASPEENLTRRHRLPAGHGAAAAVHRPALRPTATTPGTFGFLLGDAANAIHFWPGRGLNSGLASAISLARCLAVPGAARPLRDADFVRHEAVMSMLQYRHKSRAWTQMVTTDDKGDTRAIKDIIARSTEPLPDARAGAGRAGPTWKGCWSASPRSASGSRPGCPACPATRNCAPTSLRSPPRPCARSGRAAPGTP